MNRDVRAIVEAATEVGRIEGRVDHERYMMFCPDRHDRLEIEDVETRVADQFAIDQPGVVLHRLFETVEVGRVDKGRRDTETGQGILHQTDVAAVHLRRGDDVIALAEYRRDGTEGRGHSRRGADCSRTAFQRGYALLQDADRRIGDPRIGMAAALEVEDRRRRVRVRKNVGRRLVNRRRAGAEFLVDRLACVQAQCVELVELGHRDTPVFLILPRVLFRARARRPRAPRRARRPGLPRPPVRPIAARGRR